MTKNTVTASGPAQNTLKGVNVSAHIAALEASFSKYALANTEVDINT
jgi:hypothetical protein